MLLSKIIRPTILQVETTNDCILNCRICMRRKMRRPVGYMDFDEFKKLPLNGFEEICLHGWGEPLLHPRIFDFVRYVKSLGKKASLCTNGFLVEEKIDEIFESGLDELAFGLYTLKGRDKVLKAIEEVVKEKKKRGKGPTIYLDVTIFRESVEEIPEIVKFGIDVGVDGIVLHRIFNIYGVEPGIEYIDSKTEKELFRKVKEIGGDKVYLPTKHTIPCRVVLFTIFVTWDFKQFPCVFLHDREDAYLGDARTDLKTLLDRHISFVKRMRKHEICRKCFW
ncbi:MAG: radical SAM protein [Crenarchaeota archaeon]|nr:radical SAM protein [Thermoproteota archaeon]